MNLFSIAFSNIRRRKVKALITMIGLVLGVSTVIAMMGIIGAMRAELGDRIDEFGANAVILPRSERVDSGHAFLEDIRFETRILTMNDVPAIHKSDVSKYINIVSPKLIGAVSTDIGKVLMVGVDYTAESAQKPWLTLRDSAGLITGSQGYSLPDNGLVLGDTVARSLGAAVSDQVLIDGRPFIVAGILDQSGGEEDGLIYGNLSIVQTLLGRPEELTLIEISAYCNACPIEEIAAGLEMVMPDSRVIPLSRAALVREETISSFSSFGFALAGIVFLIAMLVMARSFVSSIQERTREIGIFRAIGFRKSHVGAIILIEAGLISFFGGIAGFFLGSAAAAWGGPYLAQLQNPVALRIELLLPSIALSVLAAVLTSIYPVFIAARLNPADALRFI